MKNMRFLSANFQFLEVNFFMSLIRRVYEVSFSQVAARLISPSYDTSVKLCFVIVVYPGYIHLTYM